MSLRSSLFVAAVVLALVPACKKKDDGKAADKAGTKAGQAKSAGGEAKPAGDEVKPAAPTGGALALPKLGLTMDAPAGSTAGDEIGGDGHMIQGPDLVVVVALAKDSQPKTLAEQKTDSEMYGPLNWKEESLADGWAVAFENKGGAGTNYWVIVRREIGGKAYRCDTTASRPEQGANALAACKSLKQ